MRLRRNIALAFSFAIHFVVLVLLFWIHAERPVRRPEHGISLIATLSDRNIKKQPERVAKKPDVEVTAQPGDTLFQVEFPMVAQESASSGPPGEACNIAAAIQADLAIDEPARDEIAAIPFDARSVANAIVLWTGAPENVRPALPATDMLILKRLEAVPARCLDVDQVGPDFIYATVANRTVSIALGSGQWRWRTFFDVLSTPMPATSRAEGVLRNPQ